MNLIFIGKNFVLHLFDDPTIMYMFILYIFIKTDPHPNIYYVAIPKKLPSPIQKILPPPFFPLSNILYPDFVFSTICSFDSPYKFCNVNSPGNFAWLKLHLVAVHPSLLEMKGQVTFCFELLSRESTSLNACCHSVC